MRPSCEIPSHDLRNTISSLGTAAEGRRVPLSRDIWFVAAVVMPLLLAEETHSLRSVPTDRRVAETSPEASGVVRVRSRAPNNPQGQLQERPVAIFQGKICGPTIHDDEQCVEEADSLGRQMALGRVRPKLSYHAVPLVTILRRN